jgi:hypothetical protein
MFLFFPRSDGAGGVPEPGDAVLGLSVSARTTRVRGPALPHLPSRHVIQHECHATNDVRKGAGRVQRVPARAVCGQDPHDHQAGRELSREVAPHGENLLQAAALT